LDRKVVLVAWNDNHHHVKSPYAVYIRVARNSFPYMAQTVDQKASDKYGYVLHLRATF